MDEKKKPMFSIIMACYNHAKYVETAITSILNQTYQDFELIVADDGSTDNSWEIIQKYSDRIKSFRLEENDFKKCTEMMMDMTTGQYLAQMSSDDYWYPNKLELQAKDIEENPGVYAYFTWAAFTDENLQITDADIFSYHNRNRYEWTKATFQNGTVLAINTMVTVNDKEKWLNYSQSVLDYRQLADQMVFLKMFLNGDDVHVVPQIGMKVRRHDNCIGALSRETIVRTTNETICIWNEMWETMPDDFFLKAFHDDLYNKDVVDKTEIQCERMLVLLKLAQDMPKHQTTAMNYFTRHYGDEGVVKTLSEKYHYTREDFFELTGKWGWADLYFSLLTYQQQREQNRETIDVIKTLLQCNRKLLKIVATNISNEVMPIFVEGLKDYLTATIEAMRNSYIGKEFDQKECAEILEGVNAFEDRGWIELEKITEYLEKEEDRLIKVL